METINDRHYTVYMHQNKFNGKKYIGITGKKPEDRWLKGRGYQSNRHFSSAIKNDGWDNFEHLILYENLSKEDAMQYEVELIEKYNTTNQELGYNLTIGGEAPSINSYVPVYQFTREGDFIKEFPSTSAAAEEVGGKGTSIAKVCNHKKFIAYGYAWCHKSEFEDPSEFKKWYLEALEKREEEHKKTIDAANLKKRKAIYQLSLDGELVEKFTGAPEVIDKNPDYKKVTLQAAIIAKREYKGHCWLYEDAYNDYISKKIILGEDKIKDGKRIIQLTKEGEYVAEYQNATEAAKAVGGKDPCGIALVCKWEQIMSYGYFWCYKKEYEQPDLFQKHFEQFLSRSDGWGKKYIN